MKKKQASSSFPYFFGSVILIVTAIVATAILNRTGTTAPSQDVRARASVTSLMRLTAVVTSVDGAKGVVVINGLQFTGSTPDSLKSIAQNTAGEWQVNTSGNVNLAVLSPGARVELQVNPSSFNIAEHSLTAAAITVSR
ncbi:hypothetical protein HY032_01885 [Candidatus Gottesmanbacteria bacterium]|nr:hypothetical protein [Candidatus Gottesmanbacteria bacterium]